LRGPEFLAKGIGFFVLRLAAVPVFFFVVEPLIE
jgi:hypothetical protein